MSDKFIAIFVTAIVFIRIVVLCSHGIVGNPTIKGFRIHHWMYGLAGLPFAVCLKSVELFACSLALIVDEIGFVAIRGKSHKDNYSFESIVIMLITAIFVVSTAVMIGELAG